MTFYDCIPPSINRIDLWFPSFHSVFLPPHNASTSNPTSLPPHVTAQDIGRSRSWGGGGGGGGRGMFPFHPQPPPPPPPPPIQQIHVSYDPMYKVFYVNGCAPHPWQKVMNLLLVMRVPTHPPLPGKNLPLQDTHNFSIASRTSIQTTFSSYSRGALETSGSTQTVLPLETRSTSIAALDQKIWISF